MTKISNYAPPGSAALTFPSTPGTVSAVTSVTDGTTTVAPASVVDFVGATVTDLGGGVAEVTITGGAPSGPAGGDLSGTYPNPTVARINGSPLGTTTGASSGQVLAWNGSAWAPATIVTGVWAPLMVADADGTHWDVVVDGFGNAIVVSE